MKRRPILNRITQHVIDQWPLYLTLLFLLALLAFVLLYKLGSLVPGLSAAEKTTVDTLLNPNASFQSDVLLQPVHYILYGLLYVTQLLSDSMNVVQARLASALLGGMSVLSMLYILHRWHTFRIALLTTVLYATSAGFLHAARHVDASSSFLLLPTGLALFLYAGATKNTWNRLLAIAAAIVILLSVPGGIWLLSLLLFWKRKDIIKELNHFSKLQQAATLVFSVAAASLLTASLFLRDSQDIFLTFGIGTPFVSIGQFLQNSGELLTHIFWRGPSDPTIWFGIAPILDIFMLVMLLLGTYVYILQRREDKSRMLLVILAVLVILSGLGAGIDAIYIAPFLYIIAAAGIALLLQQWFTVFPKNPFARSVGVLLISICISASVAYNLHRYFIAWPHTPEVIREFQQPLGDSDTIVPEV